MRRTVDYSNRKAGVELDSFPGSSCNLVAMEKLDCAARYLVTLGTVLNAGEAPLCVRNVM